MYLKNYIIIAFFLSSKVVLSLPLVQDNEVFDHKNHRCGIPREMPPGYSRHEFTDIYKFNWMVKINEKLKNNSDASVEFNPLFDGILIHPQAVLTNARLIESLKKKPVTVKISQFQLSLTGFGLEEYHEESHDVAEMIVHPDYRRCSLRNDVALLILSKPFDLNKSANTLCLPDRDSAVETNLHCQKIPFSLYYKPLEENCQTLTITSKDELITNDFLLPDHYTLQFQSDITNTNETSEIDLVVETNHFFCTVNGQPPYFYGGMKSNLNSKTPTTHIFYYVNDKVTDYLKWIQNILIDRFN